MGNLPVVHETITSIQCIGDVVTGNLTRPRDRWDQYANESFFGSGIYAAHVARMGDEERAREIARGMGRATGRILLGGGILRDVPVLHELATCGESLGDMIAGGDDESARARWENYAEKSFFGSAIYAAHEARMGNIERAEELGMGMAKATGKAVITVAAVAVTAITGGAAAPLGVAGAAAAGGTVGAVTGAAASASTQAIDHGSDIDAGDVVAGGIIGGVSGAVAGALAAKAAAKAARADPEVTSNTRLAARTFNAESATQDTAKITATPAGATGPNGGGPAGATGGSGPAPGASNASSTNVRPIGKGCPCKVTVKPVGKVCPGKVGVRPVGQGCHLGKVGKVDVRPVGQGCHLGKVGKVDVRPVGQGCHLGSKPGCHHGHCLGQNGVGAVPKPVGSNGVGAVPKPVGPNGVGAVPKPSGPNGVEAVPKPSGPNGVEAVPKPSGPNGLGAVPKPVVPNSPGVVPAVVPAVVPVVPVVAAAAGVGVGALIATQRNRSLEGNSLLYTILYWWRVFRRLNRALGSDAFFISCLVLFVALVLTFPGYMLRLVITLLLVGCFFSFATGD